MLKQKVESIAVQTIQEIYVSYESAKKLKSSLKNIQLGDDRSWIETKGWLGNVVKSSLSFEQVETIRQFKTSNDTCALIIRGLPIDSKAASTMFLILSREALEVRLDFLGVDAVVSWVIESSPLGV